MVTALVSRMTTPILKPLFAACFMLILAGSIGTGCKTSGNPTPRTGPINPETGDRFVFPGEKPQSPVTPPPGLVTDPIDPTNTVPVAPSPFPSPLKAATLRVGEKITVTFSDLPNNPLPHEQNIREDGTITLPFGVTLQAAGKTPGQLEDDIREAYVPRIYTRLTPIVTADARTFSVGGEVKISNRQHYTDRITVLRAIQSAGDFTDFADRRRIQLNRANGQKFIIDWYKAKDNRALDLEVFPGDQIIVDKRFF